MNLELGKKIASLRKMQKVTQTQLAEYLAVQPQTISRWETEGGMPDITFLPKIAIFFGISLDELFGMSNMEQIENLVYKYSAIRDERSFEEASRSIDLALRSIEKQIYDDKHTNSPELQQKREQLLAWKVHIYIQKSRAAQAEAENILDSLILEVSEPDNSLYFPLKFQKQQFRIQRGEGRLVLKETKNNWITNPCLEQLHCYMLALLEMEEGNEILQLWEQENVQQLVSSIDDQAIPLWQIMFSGAVIQEDLPFFEKYYNDFKKNADENAIFDAEWNLLKLYQVLGITVEIEKCKANLLKMLENLTMNEYIKSIYMSKIMETNNE